MARHDGPRELTLPAQLVAFQVLLVLTAASFGLSYLPLAPADSAVALAIAAVKVGIVGLYFMHLIEQPASHRFAALIGASFIALLVGFAMLDVATRVFRSSHATEMGGQEAVR